MKGIAVMGVDPGGKSGCAQGVFKPDAPDIATALARAVRKKQLISWEEVGPPYKQAWAIANRWSAFQFRCHVEYGIDQRDIHLVFERFDLRQLAVNLSPVQVTNGVETLLYKLGRNQSVEPNFKKTDHAVQHDETATFVEWPIGRPTFQSPGDAKHFANNQRLRKWGVWVVGSDHRRDAVRQVCMKLSEEL